MASVVSTVAAGLETPDFLELRKTTTVPARDDSGNRQLYSVVPEKQTSVRGLMGSERGYDVSGVSGAAPVPVLKEERGTKVRYRAYLSRFAHSLTSSPNPTHSSLLPYDAAQGGWCGRFPGRERDRGPFGRRATEAVRRAITRECGSPWARSRARGLFGNGCKRDGEEATEDGGRTRARKEG